MNGGPAEAGQAHSEGWNHSLARSWFRRRPGATALSVLGVVVLAAVALVCSTGTGDGSGESTIGAGVKPPPCAGPATRELVEPERGSAFSFRMPECFRSAAGLVSATARGDGGSGVLLVPLDIPLVPGEPVIGQIRVSAADVGIDASEHSDEEVTESLVAKLAQFYADRTLTKAPITPADQAEAYFLLVTNRLSKTTGQVITVDGGLHEAFLR